MRPNAKSLQISDPCRFREPSGSWLVNRTFARIAVAHARLRACVETRHDARRALPKLATSSPRRFHRIPILQAGLVECFLVV